MTLPGSIVEYIEGGRFFCALVTQDTGKRLRLLNQNGREVNMPGSRILLCSKNRHSLDMSRSDQIELLKLTSQARSNLSQEINLVEIWELASQESQPSFSADFLAELQFGGELSDDQTAAFLRAVFTDRFYFKYKNGKVTVHTPEQVEAGITPGTGLAGEFHHLWFRRTPGRAGTPAAETGRIKWPK